RPASSSDLGVEDSGGVVGGGAAAGLRVRGGVGPTAGQRLVADVDEGGVADQVDVEDLDADGVGGEHLGQMDDECITVGDRTVEGQGVPVGRGSDERAVE